MEPVRVGVVGCGVIGNVHIANAAASDLMELVAVADLREELARRASDEFKVDAVYTSADALIDDERVEAVVLALPTGVRFEPARKALASGKHVLLEKPPAMNAAQIEELIALRGDRVAACCSARYRFTAAATKAAEFLATGPLGPLRIVHCRATTPVRPSPPAAPPPWRVSRRLNGGGILVNWGVYDLDYLLGLAGWTLRPRLVLARTWRVAPDFSEYVAPGSDAETHVAATILCDDNVALTIERGEFIPAAGTGAWQFTGQKGSLRLDMLPGENQRIVHDYVVPGEGVKSAVVFENGADDDAVRRGVDEDFAKAIRQDTPPATSLENALQLQRIFDGIYCSAESGEAVALA